MKVLYKSEDGTTFKTYKEAEKRDTYLMEVEMVLKPFKPEPKHGECIQRQRGCTDILIREGLRLLRKYHSNYPEVIKAWEANPRGFVGRLLDDGDIPVYSIYNMISNIDKYDRQWDQMFYALEANRK